VSIPRAKRGRPDDAYSKAASFVTAILMKQNGHSNASPSDTRGAKEASQTCIGFPAVEASSFVFQKVLSSKTMFSADWDVKAP
jgi:hypothetical protein